MSKVDPDPDAARIVSERRHSCRCARARTSPLTVRWLAAVGRRCDALAVHQAKQPPVSVHDSWREPSAEASPRVPDTGRGSMDCGCSQAWCLIRAATWSEGV